MQNRNWLKSNSQQRRLFAGLTMLLRLKINPLLALRHYAVILMALALSLTGCASRSPALCQEQVLPAMPALSQPIPPVSYSLRVQQSLSKWEALLTESTQTGKR